MYVVKRGKNYYVRMSRNKVQYNFTLDHYPSKKEALDYVLLKESTLCTKKESMYFCVKETIDSKRKNLSPSTYYNYSNLLIRLGKEYKWFMDKKLNTIKQNDVQKFIGELTEKLSPKSVKNTYALIRTAYTAYADWKFKIILPRMVKKEPYIPNDQEVKMLLDYAKETRYYVPIRLALFSLRRSEISALTLSDIGDGEIIVNKAKVKGEGGIYIKDTKTSASTRIIKVDKELTDLIKKNGYICDFRMGSITDFISRFCKKNNIKHFTLHKLRHYFASRFSYLPQSFLKKTGGWSNTNTMVGIYTHSIQDYSNEVIGVMDELKGSTTH